MREPLFIAVDLKPVAGRVVLAGVEPGEVFHEEICRFRYPARRARGHLRWDVDRIFDEIKTGLLLAGERAHSLGRPISSIGVSGWPCDYGLVDGEGHLVDGPIAYVDDRTRNLAQSAFERVSGRDLFDRTGMQVGCSNTLFRLFGHAQNGLPASAFRLLMISDLINLFLSGRAVNEYTVAATTRLINAYTRQWDLQIAKRLGLPWNLLGEIVLPGTNLGTLKRSIADELNVGRIKVVAVTGHSSASAIIGAPLRDGWGFIISGEQAEVGIERDQPLINADVAVADFTNAAGAFGTVHLLKHSAGFGILDACVEEWRDRGLAVDYDTLINQAAGLDESGVFIAPDHESFVEPRSMLDAISKHLIESGQRVPSEPPVIARVIMDSIALRYSIILRHLERLTHRPMGGVQIAGEASGIDYLNQAVADASGLPVIAGPTDSAATGNILVQAIAAGRFSSLTEARAHVMENFALKAFAPRRSKMWREAATRFEAIQGRMKTQSLVASYSATGRLAV